MSYAPFPLVWGAFGGGGGGVSFGTIQTPFGTYPTATGSGDILTFTSSNSTVTITGTAGTDSIDFVASQSLQQVTDVGASTTNPIEVRGITVGTSSGASGTGVKIYKAVEADNEYIRFITPDDKNVRVFADNIDADYNHQLPNANGTYGLKINEISFDKQGFAEIFSDDIYEGAVNLYFTDGRAQAAMAGLYEVPLTFSTGLTRTANTITNNLSTGVSAGQNVIGGTTASTNLNLFSNNHATRGNINFGTASTYDELNDRFGISTLTPGSKLEIKTDAIGTTQAITAGINLKNTTAASSGNQQYSPAIYFSGNGWKSASTAASQSSIGRIFLAPAQGTSIVAGNIVFQISDNGSAYTNRLSINNTSAVFTSAGNVDTTIGASGYLSGAYNVTVGNTGSGITTGMKYATAGANNTQTTGTANAPILYHEFRGGFAQAASGAGVQVFAGFSPVVNHTATVGASRYEAIRVNVTETSVGTAQNYLMRLGTGGGTYAPKFDITNAGKAIYDSTITAGGTTGDRTINKPSGTVNFAAAATAITVTNSLCTTSSIVICVVRTNDTTATIKNVVPGSGSFVITLDAAATAETSVGFIVNN